MLPSLPNFAILHGTSPHLMKLERCGLISTRTSLVLQLNLLRLSQLDFCRQHLLPQLDLHRQHPVQLEPHLHLPNHVVDVQMVQISDDKEGIIDQNDTIYCS